MHTGLQRQGPYPIAPMALGHGAPQVALPGNQEQVPILPPHKVENPGAGLPPQANVPQIPLPIGPLGQRARHTSYSSLFNDETRDPMRNNAGTVSAHFDPMNNDPVVAEALLDMAVGNPNLPNAYLCCTTLHGNGRPRVYILHSMSKYTPSMDGRVTPWDSRIFCFLGDVLNGSALTVAVPTTLFMTTPQTYVYNEEALSDALTNLQDDALFPRLTVANQQTIPVTTHYVPYLPSRYAPLLMNKKGYTIKETWNLLSQVFADDAFTDQALAILNWLKVSLHAMQNNNRGNPATHITLVAPFIDQDLADHRNAILHASLPELQENSPGLDTAIVQMANTVATQAAESRTACLAKEVAQDQPTLPSTRFPSCSQPYCLS